MRIGWFPLPCLLLALSANLVAADLAITGTPLVIGASDGLDVTVEKSGLRQYFDTYNTFLRFAGTTYHSCTASVSGFPTPPTNPFVPVSHTKPTPWSIQTVVTASGLQVQHTIAYSDGEERFGHTWVVTNTTGADIADIALLYGGDTFFENADTASGSWDAVLGMVYCKRAGADGLMGLQGGPGSFPDAYLEGDFASVWTALGAGSLGNSVNPANLDNGAALQWNRPILAAGASWTITAIERWTAVNNWVASPLTVSVTAGNIAGQPTSMFDGTHGQGNIAGGSGLTDPGGSGVQTGTGGGGADSLRFTISFSTAVTGLTAADLVVGGTAGGVVTAIDPPVGPADRYIVTISGMTGSGSVSVDVLPGAAADADGNTSAASSGGDPLATWTGGATSTAGSSGGGCGGGGLGLLLLGMMAMLGLRLNRR